jgi:hypothetical protein
MDLLTYPVEELAFESNDAAHVVEIDVSASS